MTPAADAAIAVAPDRRGFLQRWPTLRRLLRHPAFVAGAVLFGFVLLVAIFAELITTSDPMRLSVRNRFKPPSLEHPFGTDNVGRSQLARIVYGARVSLLIGFSVVVMNAVFGVLLGAAAGYFRRLRCSLIRSPGPT